MSPSAVSIFVHTSRGWWLLTSISIFNFVLALYLSNTELGTSISYLGILLDQGKTSNFCENSNHSTSNLCADVRHVSTAQESDHKNETTIASLYRPNSKTFNRTSIDATIFTTNDLTIDSTISTTNNLNTTMTRTTTSWCILNKRNTASFGHFPHALQVLSLCWSFFQTQPVGRKCGVYVRNLPSLGPKHLDWRAALVLDVMKCDYVSGAEPPTSLDPNYSYRPKLSQVMEHHFFSKPDDAKVLRQNLNRANTTIGREKTSNRSDPNSVGLHIGLIDRKTTRKILNLDAIETALRLEFPDAFLERSTMDDMTPLEQFQWWNRQHVVVLGHGAAVANLIFMEPNSAVVEIFPPRYYWLCFWKLGQSVGIRNYGYFNNVTDPLADFRKYSREFEKRVQYRSVDLEPPVSAVLDLVKQAVAEAKTGNYTPGVPIELW